MNNRIRILQSVESLGIGGNELFVMNFYRQINKEKFQVDFIIYEDRLEFQEEVKRLGAKVFLAPAVSGNKINKFLQRMKYVYKVLKENRYDVIHCHGCSFLAILRAAIPATRIKGLRIISHTHSVGKVDKNVLDIFIRGVLKRYLSAIVDYGFACSDFAGVSKYTKRFMLSSKYEIIHNAINVEKYSFNLKNRNNVREKYNIGSKILLGNIGRLSKEKNQLFLLDIFYHLLKERNDIALMIVGGGTLETALKGKISELQIEEQVILTGSVMDVEKYYSAMDVFVMPSLYEGLPFTVIEAQVNGLQCVLADTITKMADVSGNTKFISLDESCEKWGREILNSSVSRSSEDRINLVKKDYDLRKEVLKLEKYYSGEKESRAIEVG